MVLVKIFDHLSPRSLVAVSSSYFSHLLKHEFSQSPDLFAILRMIHGVVLHEKGLHGKKSAEYPLKPTTKAELVSFLALKCSHESQQA